MVLSEDLWWKYKNNFQDGFIYNKLRWIIRKMFISFNKKIFFFRIPPSDVLRWLKASRSLLIEAKISFDVFQLYFNTRIIQIRFKNSLTNETVSMRKSLLIRIFIYSTEANAMISKFFRFQHFEGNSKQFFTWIRLSKDFNHVEVLLGVLIL